MTKDKKENQILIFRIKRGEEKAFRQAYNEYQNDLYRVALKYLRTRELAEDAVHDVFVKLWNKKGTLKTSGSLRGFLFTALKNHVFNMLDSHKRELKRNIEFLYDEQARTTEDNAETLSKYRPALDEAIGLLPESRRRVVNLRLKEG